MPDHPVKPLLAYSWEMDWPQAVSESLSVYSDGSVWYWSLRAAEPAMRERAGTFSFQLRDNEFKGIREMAERLATTPSTGGSQAQGAIVYGLSASDPGSGQAQFFLLSPGADVVFPDDVMKAHRLGDELRKRAEDAPTATLRLSWSLPSGGVTVGVPANVLFEFENKGVKPVGVVAQAGGYGLIAYVGGYEERWLQGDDQKTMGITGPKGDILGGIYTPAQIPPGGKAGAFFSEALHASTSGNIGISAQVSGNMTLHYPKGSGQEVNEQFPNAEFTIQSPPVNIEVAAS